MIQYSFTIHGHKNILSTHKRTVEFTKASELTKKGDCIVGVRAGFSLLQLQKFLNLKRVRIVIEADNIRDSITAAPNKNFSSGRELIIRLGDFDSERTFAVRADKSSNELKRELVEALRNESKGRVTVYQE